MEEDTVMVDEQIWDCASKVFKRWADPPMPNDSQYDEFRQEIEREIAQAQAEISFSAGERQGYEKGWNDAKKYDRRYKA